MKKILWFFLALVVLLVGCGVPSEEVIIRDATVAANAAALSIESAQSAAEALYQTEQELVLYSASKQMGATKESVRLAVEAVRKRWEPVKELFTQARDLHSKLALAVNTADTMNIGQLSADLARVQNQIVTAMAEARGRIGGIK